MGVERNRRTHCPQGHELGGKNLYVNKTNGSRVCRQCRRDSQRRCNEFLRARARRREQLLARQVVAE